MPSSETEIVNSALIKIGEQTVTSLDDNREQAQIAKRQYSLKRDELLRTYRWNFALARRELAPEAEDPPFGFGSKFLMPTDALRIISIYDPSQRLRNYTATDQDWKVEGRYVLANGDKIEIFYIRRVTNVLEFDALFAEALAWFLAQDIAFALSTGPQMLQQLRNGFSQAIRNARFADAIEGKPEVLESSEWLESRIARSSVGPRQGPVS